MKGKEKVIFFVWGVLFNLVLKYVIIQSHRIINRIKQLILFLKNDLQKAG